MRDNAPLLTIRLHFFRIQAWVGIVTVLIVWQGFTSADYLDKRREKTDDFKQTAKNIGAIYAAMSVDEGADIAQFLTGFSSEPGLLSVCVYNLDGKQAGFWQRNGNQLPCPALLMTSGAESTLLSLTLTEPIMQGNSYLGMIYLRGEFSSLKQRMIDSAFVLGSLLLVTLVASFSAAHLGARAIARPLQALHAQIECLKENDVAFCPLAPHFLTKEIQELASAIAELRTHLASTRVSKSHLANVRGWHLTLLSGLIAGLKQRIGSDSPLAEYLANYALFLQADRGELPPPPCVFSLASVLDLSVRSARRTHAPDGQVALTTSVQSGIPKQWLGQPETVEALLRHLLLIGLKRTQRGFVNLRIELVPAAIDVTSPSLHILYEDSGSLIQQWQLHYWLAATRDDAPPVSLPHDISWLLLARLVKRLGGTISGQSGRDNGIALEILFPVTIPLAQELPASTQPFLPYAHSHPPLVLVAESDKEHRTLLATLLKEAGCDFILVNTHAQLIELAPQLPVAAILLQPDAISTIEHSVRRLCQLMDSGLLAKTPLWIAVEAISGESINYWKELGAEELLLTPIQTTAIKHACAKLAPPDACFYQAVDERVRQDLSEDILAAMPAMNRMLGEQIAQVEPLIDAFAKGDAPPLVVHQAHAVKSASLALGYYRLAALMDQIEHASSTRMFSSFPANWTMIARILRQAGF